MYSAYCSAKALAQFKGLLVRSGQAYLGNEAEKVVRKWLEEWSTVLFKYNMRIIVLNWSTEIIVSAETLNELMISKYNDNTELWKRTFWPPDQGIDQEESISKKPSLDQLINRSKRYTTWLVQSMM